MNIDLEALLRAHLHELGTADVPTNDDAIFVARVMQRVHASPPPMLAPDAALYALRKQQTSQVVGGWAGASLALGTTLATVGWAWAAPESPPTGTLSLVWAGVAALVACAFLAPRAGR